MIKNDFHCSYYIQFYFIHNLCKVTKADWVRQFTMPSKSNASASSTSFIISSSHVTGGNLVKTSKEAMQQLYKHQLDSLMEEKSRQKQVDRARKD
jgi:hypothetical protein